jgi:phage/conjugal plasmid C-4 type zinc finger TraR family protein
MEDSDFASLLEAVHNASALAAHLAQQKTPVGPSAEFCQALDCEVPIPEARRLAVPGVKFCSQCQTHREKRGRP